MMRQFAISLSFVVNPPRRGSKSAYFNKGPKMFINGARQLCDSGASHVQTSSCVCFAYIYVRYSG